MEFDSNLKLAETLETFNANVTRARTALEGEIDVFANHRDHDALLAKARKLAIVQTRRQVGEEAWQRFVGASGRGWRGAIPAT